MRRIGKEIARATAGLLLVLAATTTLGFGKDFSKTLVLEPGGRLSLKTYKGSIKLLSWDRGEVEIVARIVAPEDVDGDYGRRTVEATEVEVQGGGRAVRIRSDYSRVPAMKKKWWSMVTVLPYVHYQIRAPRKLDIDLEDYKSDIEVYGFEGRMDLETYKGNVDLKDLSGDIRLETYKGKVRADALRGSLDLQSYKGELSLQVYQLLGSSRAETYKGTINLALPQSHGFSLRTEIGRRGDFATDFDLAQPEGPRRRGEQRWTAAVNGGGPELRVKTHKGEIRLKRQ